MPFLGSSRIRKNQAEDIFYLGVCWVDKFRGPFLPHFVALPGVTWFSLLASTNFGSSQGSPLRRSALCGAAKTSMAQVLLEQLGEKNEAKA